MYWWSVDLLMKYCCILNVNEVTSLSRILWSVSFVTLAATCQLSFQKLTYKFWEVTVRTFVMKFQNVEREKVCLYLTKSKTRMCVWCALVRSMSNQPSGREIITTASWSWFFSSNGMFLWDYTRNFVIGQTVGWWYQYTSAKPILFDILSCFHSYSQQCLPFLNW